ncbi:Bifunctional ligase/repressor BirA [Serratia symbiotica]|nr:Bifunctional ligase/repressor BirA [Serratia symbiotica]
MKDHKMTLKLMALLADGGAHSGEYLGHSLGMSHSMIQQHIQTILKWGVDVFSITGKEYCLPNPIQLLEPNRILKFLEDKRLTVLSVVDSTNQYLLDRIDRLQSGDACVAEYQYAGRGRRGRKWYSPFGANLYLSIFWRLEYGIAATGLSLVIAIVMAEVLHHLGAEDVRVKWPNDLYLNNRKLAGILIEATRRSGGVAHLVMGAGINLAMCGTNANFINQEWINLKESGIRIDRNELVTSLINKLRQSLKQFENDGLTPFVARWRLLDNCIDRPVKLLMGEQQILGIYRGINQQGGLLLDQQGVIKLFNSGEISLRLAE